jgi:phosphinothricin acetyltransferase
MNTIRLAADADAQAIQAIYAPYVQHMPISFELEPPLVSSLWVRLVVEPGAATTSR